MQALVLCDILDTAVPALQQALLDTESNRRLLWWFADRTDAALRHFGLIISAEERNRLMHVENGNRGPRNFQPYNNQVATRQTRRDTPETNIVWSGVPDFIQQIPTTAPDVTYPPPVIQIPEASTSTMIIQPPTYHLLTQEAVTEVQNKRVMERVQCYVRWNRTAAYIPRKTEYRWGNKDLSQ